MASTPGVYLNTVSATAGISDEHERLAFQEGHDADIASNIAPTTTEAELRVDKEMSHDAESIKSAEKGAHIGDEEAQLSEKDKSAGSTDPNEIWWDGETDPANPLNWSMKRKWGNLTILSFITFITPLASSMFAPGVEGVLSEFNSDSDLLATFVVSIYLLGYCVGPLFIAPLSEIYGRYWIYVINNGLFVVFAVTCAVAHNMNELIAFRFLHGLVGVAPLTIGGGTIADCMRVEKRGAAMAIYSLGPLIGPVVGPIAGSYLTAAKGWRWIFWLLAIISGASFILSIFLLEETYAPTLLERKTKRLRKETGNPNLHSRLESKLTPRQIFQIAVFRPTKMLLFSPIIAAVCLYTAVAYGILYMLFTTFSFVYTEVYGFSVADTGLTFIPLGIGMILSLGIMGTLTDRIIKGKQARGEAVKPEDRLPLGVVLLGAFSMPVGLFIYGWTVEYKVHWIVPMIGTLFCGFGMLIIFMAMQTYLIDAFTAYAASAVAANTVLRSLFGGLLPLSGLRLYNALGFGWGNSLLAFVGIALVPIPALFSIYGERLRTHPRFQIKL